LVIWEPVCNQAGEVHRFHDAGIVKLASKGLLPFDLLRHDLQLRDAHSKQALGGHAVTNIGRPRLLAGLLLQLGYYGCDSVHEFSPKL
jgi:hypothetical protein